MGDSVPKKRKPRVKTDESDPTSTTGLDETIRRRLAQPSDDPSRTWSERIADALITAAAGGDLKSCDVLFRRAGASAGEGVEAPASIDDATARKVLEAVRGPIKARTSR